MTTTPHRRRLPLVGCTAGLVVVVALLVAGCGDDDAASTDTTTSTVATSATTGATTTAAPTSATTSSAVPTTSGGAPVPDGSGCTPGPAPLPDGHWYGLVVDATAEVLSFDLACWFTGDEANAAAAEDGEESPPPNDYYVRNDNPASRDLPVARDTQVTWYPSGDPTDTAVVGYTDWLDRRAERPFQLAVWIDVRDGTITAIQENWVP